MREGQGTFNVRHRQQTQFRVNSERSAADERIKNFKNSNMEEKREWLDIYGKMRVSEKGEIQAS